MSTKSPDTQDDSDLNGESDAYVIPREWLANAPTATITDGETEYYAVLYTVERTVTSDEDVLAGRKQGRGEEWTIHALYVRADGQRAVEYPYDARVVETGDGIDVTPRNFEATVAVDGEIVTPHAAPQSQLVLEALDALHDIQPEVEA